jgi:hypothetical protein
MLAQMTNGATLIRKPLLGFLINSNNITTRHLQSIHKSMMLTPPKHAKTSLATHPSYRMDVYVRLMANASVKIVPICLYAWVKPMEHIVQLTTSAI